MFGVFNQRGWLVYSNVFRIEMPDGLVDGLVRRLHLVFQLVLPVFIRAVPPLIKNLNNSARRSLGAFSLMERGFDALVQNV